MTTLKNPDDSGGGRHVTPNPHAFYYVKEKPRAEVAPHVTGAGAPLTGTGRQVCALQSPWKGQVAGHMQVQGLQGAVRPSG